MLLITHKDKKYSLTVELYLYSFLKSLGVTSLVEVSIEEVECVEPLVQEKLDAYNFVNNLGKLFPHFDKQKFVDNILKEKGYNIRQQYFSGDYYTYGWTDWFVNGKLEPTVGSYEDVFRLLRVSYPYEYIDNAEKEHEVLRTQQEKDFVERWLAA